MAIKQLLLQRETTPGVPATNAMKAYGGLKLTPKWSTERQKFRGTGYRTVSASNKTAEFGEHSVEAPQDFNAIVPVMASVIGTPVSEPAVAEAITAHKHVSTLKGRGDRTSDSFTAVWGDGDFAILMSYLRFNSLSFGVQRGELTFGTNAISRTPDESASFPTTGIVDLPAVPISTMWYDVFIDDSWDTLGTTQMLSCYESSVEVGDTWGMDTPINSAILSFQSLQENPEVDFTGQMQVGLDPAISGLFSSYKAGDLKYVRIAAEGPVIETVAGAPVHYSIQCDFCLQVDSPGEIGKAPGSNTDVLPFTYDLATDPETQNTIEFTVVNAVASL